MSRLLYIATVAITIKGVRTPYARHFQRLGWQVDGMAKGLEDSKCSPEPFHALWNVEWSRSPFDHKNLTAALRTVQSVVQQGKYDIVHVHTPIAGFITRLAISRLPRASRPIVIYGAHGFHFYPGGPKLKNRIYLQLEKL